MSYIYGRYNLRYTNHKAQSRLQLLVLDTSRPRRQCWFLRTLKTRQKHPRLQCKIHLHTAMDYRLILTNGTFEAPSRLSKGGPKG